MKKTLFLLPLLALAACTGEQNNLAVYGHCLTWHSQLPKWFPENEDGTDVTPEELKARMKEHIYTVVGRYKGRIKGWDVVNGRERKELLDNKLDGLTAVQFIYRGADSPDLLRRSAP